MKGIVHITGILLAAAFFFSYQSKAKSSGSLIQKELEARIKKNKEDAGLRCHMEMLKGAEAHVDSIIVNEINIELMGEIGFPERPLRPTDYPQNINLIKGSRDSVKTE